MSEQQIARELLRITQLPALEFQRELETVIDSTLTIRLLADLLASDLSNQQKQLAAVGINRVIQLRMEGDCSRWRRLWEEFLREVLNHEDKNHISWSHLSITTRGLKLLLEESDSHLCDLLTPVFSSLSFSAQSLLYQTFLNLETTPTSRYVFLRETIEDYLHNAFIFAAYLHDQPSPSSQLVELESSSLKILELLLSHLGQDTHAPLIEMLTKLSLNTDLFLLIAQELLYQQRESYNSLLRRQFSNNCIHQITFGSQNVKREECKISSIKVFSYAVRRYDFRAGIQEFDSLKMLNFLEQLCPLAIDWLISGKAKEQASELIGLLVVGCRFNFMLQIYTQKFLEIYYQICIPFLISNQDEIDTFENDSDQFIAQAEELTERTDDRSLTTRSQAGLLLEQIVDACHGTLPTLISSLIAIIRYHLCGENNQEHLPPALCFGPLPSLETALTVLTIFSSKYQQRKELLQDIKQRIFIDELLRVRGLDKARVLIFLAYNYEEMFKQSNQEGGRWLQWAENGLDDNGALPACSLLLFQNCLQLGFGANIWQCLLKRIRTTPLRGLIRLLKKIVKKRMEKLPAEAIVELIEKIIERMDRQCERIPKDNEVYRGSDMLYACLAVIETASQNKKYLKEEPLVIHAFWPVINLLSESNRIEFEDNIIRIYNNLLQVSVSQRHFSYLSHFSSIIVKHASLSPLLSTYTLLLRQCNSFFYSSEGPHLLNSLLTSLQDAFAVCPTESSLIRICSLLQYAYYSYGQLIEKGDFFRILKEMYDENKNRWGDETLATVINLMLIGAGIFGKRELMVVGENHIEIYRGYQAKILAVGMRKWIEKEWQSEELLQYMRYCIRLLHFIRESSLSPRPQTPYFTPQFPSLIALDPFAEITITLDFLKQQLSHNRYDRILQDLSQEISLGEIRDLLSRRIIERSMRHFVKINRNN